MANKNNSITNHCCWGRKKEKNNGKKITKENIYVYVCLGKKLNFLSSAFFFSVGCLGGLNFYLNFWGIVLSPRRGFVVKEQTIIHPFVCVCVYTLLLFFCCLSSSFLLPLDTEWKLYHLYVQRLLMKKKHCEQQQDEGKKKMKQLQIESLYKVT